MEYYAKPPECIAICLQEQLCDIGNTPPIQPDLESFYTTPSFPKCIRRSSQINAFASFSAENPFNGITLNIGNLPPLTLYNFYSPGRPKALAILTKALLPDPSSLIMGDFNARHEWWYGRQPPIHTRDDSSLIVDWLSENSFSLLSPFGIATHFPLNINNTINY
jgi:hypothetical protein